MVSTIIPHKEKKNAYNIAIVLFVALGSLAFGYSVGIIGTTLAQPSFMHVAHPDTVDYILLTVIIVPTLNLTLVPILPLS